MKKINTLKGMLFAVSAMFALTTVASAGPLNNVYLEVGGSAVGAIAEGSSNDAQSATTTGAVGKTATTADYGIGFMSNRDRKMGFDIGYIVTPGQAKISHTSDSATATKVSLDISDMTQYYIAPMINITEDASIYVKFAQNSTDLTVVGDVNKISSMDGDTIAVGTVMSWGSNLYMRTEAGQTEYDTLKFTGLGTAGGVLTTETVTVTPKVNYGRIALGYKF